MQYNGRFIVSSLGLPGDWLWRPLGAAIGFASFFLLLSGFILKLWKVEIDIAAARKRDDGHVIHAEKLQSKSMQSVVPVAVDLDSYSLEVHNRHLARRRTTVKTILHPVTCSFEPGKINVIMGPSGSGKTSLLQSLAQRLDGTLASEYRPSGHILLNGAIPSSDVLRAIASFVTQDDDALMGELTVRETLVGQSPIAVFYGRGKHTLAPVSLTAVTGICRTSQAASVDEHRREDTTRRGCPLEDGAQGVCRQCHRQ